MSDPRLERVLAIETSCDDTSVAVVNRDRWVESVCSAHQDLAHAPFGGIVPELASRNHTVALLPLVEQALKQSGRLWTDIQGIAVTSRPGLVGSLLVGVVTAKTLSLAKQIPFIGVNHIEGHLVAPLLRDSQYSPPEGFDFPYLALAISGGHTHLFRVERAGRSVLLGQTVDDAAGEAFDKFGKMVGLGYPGGVQVDRLSKSGNPSAYSFPRGLMHEENFNFSFSGLKTAAQRALSGLSKEEIQERRPSLCSSYQEAIVDVLLAKMDRAVNHTGLSRVTLTGGVSANSRLRSRAQDWAKLKGVELALPPLRYCTDNAAMIGLAGILRLQMGEVSGQDLGPSPSALPGDYKTLR